MDSLLAILEALRYSYHMCSIAEDRDSGRHKDQAYGLVYSSHSHSRYS